MGCQLRCCPPKLALCRFPALSSLREDKKLTGWKQGHTPAEFSEPLPLAGVLFWLFLLKDCLVAGEARIIITGATNDRLVDSNH